MIAAAATFCRATIRFSPHEELAVNLRTWLVALLAIGLLTATSLPQEPSSKDKEASPAKKSPTVKVEKGPLTSAISMKGTVQVDGAKEVIVRLKAWSGPLVIQKAVEHGAAVKKGDVIVEFESEKLDQALRDAKQMRELAELSIRQAESELPLLEKQASMDLAAAELANKEATDDLNYYLAVGRPMAEQMATFRLKSANYSLEYAREELKQLQKMYKDKDLTEETEQLILKRYLRTVEQSEFMLKSAQIDTEHSLKVLIPRKEQSAREAAAKAEVTLTRAREVQPLALKQKRLALAKLHYDDVLAREKLADLEKDRAALVVKAPSDGLAYHGRIARGQWLGAAGPDGALARGGNVAPGSVFMGILPRDKMVIRAEVDEKDLAGLRPGLAGKLSPTAFPEEKIAVKVTRVAPAPLAGKFEVSLTPDGKATGSLVPGMTCAIRVALSRNPNALTVPAAAVFEDVDEDIHYVYRAGSTEKHAVRIGRRSGDRVEITDGLAENDEIRATRP
jgi:HlyD family secretion protein